MTYLWHLGFIPMGFMLIASLIINQICLRKAMNYVPNWLILFMSLFVPVCFSTKDVNQSRQKEAKMIQKKTFFYQTSASLLIYGSSILIIMILVNNSSINYEEEVILNNQRFNAYGTLVLIMGLFSFILSFSPRCSEFFSCQKSNQDEEIEDQSENCSKLVLRSFWAIFVFGLICTPLVLPNLITQHFLNGYNQPSFVVYSHNRNESKIVQVTTIIGFTGKIDGLLGNQWMAKSALPANVTRQIQGVPNLKGQKIYQKWSKKFFFNFLFTVKGIDGYVISISRLNWEEARDSILENNPAAIMIIDTERLMQSSPQPQFYEIQNNVSIPTFLVRKEDGHHFLPELEPESNLKFVTSVKIYGSYNAIPNPEWICDVKDYDDCVPLEFSLEGYLAGT